MKTIKITNIKKYYKKLGEKSEHLNDYENYKVITNIKK